MCGSAVLDKDGVSGKSELIADNVLHNYLIAHYNEFLQTFP